MDPEQLASYRAQYDALRREHETLLAMEKNVEQRRREYLESTSYPFLGAFMISSLMIPFAGFLLKCEEEEKREEMQRAQQQYPVQLELDFD